MKKIIFLLVMIFAICGCENEEDMRDGRFSCKIDGVIWNPRPDTKSTAGWEHKSVDIYYIPVTSGFLRLTAFVEKGSFHTKEYIYLQTDKALDIGIVYPITGYYDPIDSFYKITEGSIVLTHIDIIESKAGAGTKVSGRFDFKAKDSISGKTVIVSDGRFNSKYTN